jgi:hypothetical protein
MGGDVLRVQYYQPTNSNFNGTFTFNGQMTNNGAPDPELGFRAARRERSGR